MAISLFPLIFFPIYILMQHPIQETQQLSIPFLMKNNNTLPSMAVVPFLSLIFTFCLYPEIAQGSKLSQTTNNLQTYIVYVKHPESTVFSQSEDLESYYQSFFPVSTTSSNQQTRIVYSYRNVVTGFAARLTQEEVRAMEKKDGFVSARPERILHVQTTHTPDFLGLHQDMGFWKESNFGKGVIIGVLDSGVLPSHPSFSDEGIPPPPAKWKGKCEFNISDCNNKLIGARSFNLGAKAIKGEAVEPPLDDDGHGTHTAGTAAGNFVKYADVLGNAKGTAVGMAPYAHLAIYKVCFAEGCPDSDILAALDAAIEDGVDALSLSIGASSVPFFQDTIAVGSFAAIQKGIFVSAAAGNSGPFSSTLSNEAPWILTVGASTTDRRIVATAKIGNGEEFDGESLYQPNDFPSTLLPLVYAGANNPRSRFCAKGSLNRIFVKGKVVLCEQGGGISRIAKGVEVKNAGGAAMILMNDESSGFSTLADAHVLPATHVSYAAGLKIKTYIGSVATPTATVLFKGTVFGNLLTPAVASFSSRGPNLASPGIVKPDIIGPGVNILAAWPFPLDSNTNSKSTFNIISGTSMACPHLSGIAALLKSSHPYWSPAAIKSAIMTSADLVNLEGTPIVDETLQPADVFATGSGHVNPSKANDPGLIYDIQPDEYIPYLCGLGYSDSDVGIIAHKPIKCSEVASIPEGELNYPSFSVALGQAQTFTRTVTNVGEANSIYTVAIDVPQGVEISVNPSTLDFAMVNQKLTYSATFSLARFSDFKAGEFAQGAIHWISTKYSVKSPVSIKFE